MTQWATAHEQWVEWANAPLLAVAPCEVVDAFDDELREMLVAAPFGPPPAAEPVRLARLGESMPFDSMATMVRPPPGQSTASLVEDEDEDEDAASTLVHAARIVDDDPGARLDVALQTPGGGLQVELEPAPPSEGQAGWYIPALTDSARAAEDARHGVPTTPLDAGTMVTPPPIDLGRPPVDPATTFGAHAPMAFAASPVATEAVPVRSGTTLIPTDEAASSQTAGVINVQARDEPAYPPARRPSKIVISTPVEPPRAPAPTSVAAAVYDDSGEYPRPGAEPTPIEAETSDAIEADLDPDVIESADLLESVEPPSRDAPPRPPSPKPTGARPSDAPPPPPRAEPQKSEPVREPGTPPAPPQRPEPASPPPRPELRPVAADSAGEPPPRRVAGLVTGQTLPPTDEPHWSASVFGEHYIALARPGAERIAVAEAEFAIALTGVGAGATAVDVGCGDGHHANALADRGLRVLGLESSPAQLARASDAFGSGLPNLRWLLADIRQRPVAETFDLVLCLGTTFGQYDDVQNRGVLEALRDLCRPNGGKMVLQVLNRDYVVPRLPARSWWQGQGCLVLDEVEMQDWASRLAVRRTIVFEDGRQFEHAYSLRAYALHELVAMCEGAGLRVLEASGSRHTRGRFFGATSPDIWLALERR